MSGAESSSSSPSFSSSAVRKRNARLIVAFLIVAIAGSILPTIKWQKGAEQTLCQSTQRRLATALLLYSADYEGCLPPPVTRIEGVWRTWVDQVDPYTSRGDSSILAECPTNPAPGGIEKETGCPFPWSYAFNDRFFGKFGPGPFPIENLEMQAQTVLIVESGKGRSGAPAQNSVRAAYTDTGTEPGSYPSPHSDRMNIAAADTHTVNIKVAHYETRGHDPLLGRLGGAIYNWNGGHPNGYTAGPPRE